MHARRESASFRPGVPSRGAKRGRITLFIGTGGHMPGDDHPATHLQYLPSMTSDYSRISDTAKAIDPFIKPALLSYLASLPLSSAGRQLGSPFVIADYGAADGVNSSQLLEQIIRFLRQAHPLLGIRLVYIDIADPAPFHHFWKNSGLSGLPRVEAEYLQRSFYEPLPELAGNVDIGISSTSLHWLNTKTVDTTFFYHPTCIQANQLPAAERKKFYSKWISDWRVFFRERSRDLAHGGMLYLATLTDLGGDRWPASAGYNNLREVCVSLYQEGRISKQELDAIFIPDYFATPDEIASLVAEESISQHFSLKSLKTLTVPCAYSSRMQNAGNDARKRQYLAYSLARVVRAWSESSIRVGLSRDNEGLIDEIYRRLAERFFERPEGLPYQYCLMELLRRNTPAGTEGFGPGKGTGALQT